MERGIVRTCTVIGAIFFSNLTIAAYLIAWVLLEEKPKNSEKDVN
jgi:phage shock protein PspC (stress-responsive transcriptional regulator)